MSDVIYSDETLQPLGKTALIPCAAHGEQYGQLLQHVYMVVKDPDLPDGPVHAWRCVDPDPEHTRLTDPGTYLSVRLSMRCPHGKPSNTCCGNAEWLRVVHAINAEQPGTIGAPLVCYDWWAKGWAEEYPEFRILLSAEGDDNRNYVQAKTVRAAEMLRRAFKTVTGREYPA